MNHQGLHAGRAVLSSSNSTTSSSSYYSVSSLTDHLQFMQQQELAYCITKEYLAVGAIAVVSPSTTTTTTAETIAITNVNGTTTTTATDDSMTSIKITPHDRRALYEWSYQIVDSFMVDRSVACIGMSYLDRYMSNTTSSTSLNNTRAIMALYSRREYQLVLISSLIIALKCHAGIKISLPFMANTLCRGLYTEDEIEIMEMDILHTLAWKLHGPCPHDFIDVISELVLASSYVPAPVRAAVAPAVLPRPYSNNNEDDDVEVPSDGVVVQVSPTTAATRSRSYLNVATIAKLYVEEVMLDYSRSGLQPSSALAIEALVVTLQQRTSELNPVDVMAWTSTISLFSAGSNMSLDQDYNNNFVNDPTNKVGGIDESSPSTLTTSSHAVDDVDNQDYKQQNHDDQCHSTIARKVTI